jgi:hypothetical protein
VPPVDEPTRVEIHHTDLRIVDGVVLQVRYLYGEMVSKREGEPVGFGDRESYLTRILSAEAATSGRVLTAVMNGYLFDDEGAPLTDVVVRSQPDGGLVVVMPDDAEVGRTVSQEEKIPAPGAATAGSGSGGP